MKIEKLNNEANEAWQKIVQHEIDNVEFWGQAAHDKEYKHLCFII